MASMHPHPNPILVRLMMVHSMVVMAAMALTMAMDVMDEMAMPLI